jgi:DNA-binding CsgD family transcriptional regulator
MEAIAMQYKLTPSELRVLRAVIEIGGVPAIADALGIKPATLRSHLHHVLQKTGANGRSTSSSWSSAPAPALPNSLNGPPKLDFICRSRQVPEVQSEKTGHHDSTAALPSAADVSADRCNRR